MTQQSRLLSRLPEILRSERRVATPNLASHAAKEDFKYGGPVRFAILVTHQLNITTIRSAVDELLTSEP
jgi:hypothetical protein